MEKINHQRTQTPIQLISSSSSHFPKLFTKILLLFSVLSVVLSYPLLWNFHILACGLQQLFNFSVGKNYMFLLCNGLLVFIATSSGLIGGSAGETEFKAEKSILNSKGNFQRESQVEVESSELKGSIAKAETKVLIPEVDQQEQDSKMDQLALEQGSEDVPMVVEAEQQSLELVSVPDEDQYEDEDDALGQMSKEELNKKCEEFIRRMKEEIKFEAQQLIMVQ